ncbi:hypothetical protein BKA63DRAFT_168018 [Paraphoma chrysanthemicola]|nr:hypothetical protein BKA63DRAFT_168018 [Paraphoma chrysanthemicola]
MKRLLWFCLLGDILPVTVSAFSSNDSLSFVLPPLPPLDVNRDCEYTAIWLADRNVTIASVAMMMDNMCNTTYKKSPSWENWMEWYFSNSSDEKVMEIYNFTLSHCNRKYCEKLEWEGNADLAGRGMMITYWLEISLATFYALVISTMEKPSTSSPHSSRPIRFQHLYKILQYVQPAATGSAPVLLDSMIMFSIAMLAAAVYAFGSSLSTKRCMTKAEWAPVLFMATFSTLPPVLMQLVAQPMWRQMFRVCQWIFIGLLVLAVHMLAVTFSSPEIITYTKAQIPDNKQIYDERCSAATKPLETTMKVFKIAAPVAVAILVTVFLPWDRRFHWAKPLRSAVWIVTAILSFSGMWVLLSIFSAYRWSQATQSGASNKELAWGFGQILALVQWIPSMADFVCIYFYGTEFGLQAHMPRMYHVRRVSTDCEHSRSATRDLANTNTKSPLKSKSMSMPHGP